MIGIYCRTSKARKEKYTIEVQKEKGIKFAKSLGLPYKIYVDDGISGTLDESSRAGLSNLFEDMRSNNITLTYVIEQSRIERDPPTWHLFVSLCLNYKIKYYPGGTEFDLDNPTNRMLAELTTVVNAYYAERTSRNVKEANAKKVRAGKTHGLKPYGYTRDELNNYIIFEEEAEVVRRMFQLSLEGNGAYTIANIFNSESIPTKYSGNFEGVIVRKNPDQLDKPREFKKKEVIWRGNVISDMLRNPIYKGTRVWKMYEDYYVYEGGKRHKKKRVADIIETNGLVPAIVDEQIWDMVQLNFERNKKNLGPKEYYHYLLNGIIFCAKCSYEYRGKKRPKGKDFSYKCTNKIYPNAKCNNRGISIPKIETFIIHLLLKNKQSYDLFKNIPNKVTNVDEINKALESKNKELNKVLKKIENLVAFVTNLDSRDDFKEISNELKKLNQSKNRIITEKVILETKLKESISGSFDEKLKAAQKAANSIKSKLNDRDNFDLIKKLIRSLVEKVTVEYQEETKNYLIQVSLIGKDETLNIQNNRYSNIWTFTDKNGEIEFSQKNKPKWLKAVGFSSLRKGKRIYHYGIKITKENYINFD